MNLQNFPVFYKLKIDQEKLNETFKFENGTGAILHVAENFNILQQFSHEVVKVS